MTFEPIFNWWLRWWPRGKRSGLLLTRDSNVQLMLPKKPTPGAFPAASPTGAAPRRKNLPTKQPCHFHFHLKNAKKRFAPSSRVIKRYFFMYSVMKKGKGWRAASAPQDLLGIGLKWSLNPSSKSLSLSYISRPPFLEPHPEATTWARKPARGENSPPQIHSWDEMNLPCTQSSKVEAAASHPQVPQALRATCREAGSKIPVDKAARGSAHPPFLREPAGKPPGERDKAPQPTATKTCVHTIKRSRKTFLEMD